MHNSIRTISSLENFSKSWLNFASLLVTSSRPVDIGPCNLNGQKTFAFFKSKCVCLSLKVCLVLVFFYLAIDCWGPIVKQVKINKGLRGIGAINGEKVLIIIKNNNSNIGLLLELIRSYTNCLLGL